MNKKTQLGAVRRALISVSNKSGLVDFARALVTRQVEILASGGSAKAIEAAGLKVTRVEDYTRSPEVLDGRVKTLHPKIHAGILADRRDAAHLAALEKHDYPPIDLVVCNLYPFRETLAKGAERDELIENIDIGGPTLVRAAGKNADGGVAVVVDPADYSRIVAALDQDGIIDQTLRRELAAKAFRHVADYDEAIAAWFETAGLGAPKGRAAAFVPEELHGIRRQAVLRYGENPHQEGFLYRIEGENTGVALGKQLGGKALSYTNYLDLDAAYRAAYTLANDSCAIVKHTNPCGMAQAADQRAAFARALSGDPVSAFGSVIGFNRPLTGPTAEAIRESKLFVECIVAPGFDQAALDVLGKRENLRLVVAPPGDPAPAWSAHRIGGGLLVQKSDPGIADPATWRTVTKKKPEPAWTEELAFAMHAAMVLKSNAIAVTSDLTLRGAGAGHMSRVDSTREALAKAGEHCRGGFLASDAFFPFDDSVRLAAAAGIVAVVQPGGSKRDDEVIAACDELGLVMMFTDRRHFRH